MKKFIEKLHFITHDINHLTHIEQAQVACEAGAKWIQYRCLSKNDDELLKDIDVIAEICDDWGATLIVTDHIHLNGKADIQGFHIENMSADFTDIRNLVGEAITLGGSANTIENLLRIAQEGADYAGFGPFAETSTKPNSYPHIDLSQYHRAVMVLRDQGLDLPILAVGGVKLEDLDDLLGTGIFGIAVSSAINQASNMNEAYRSFYDKIM